MRLIDADVSIEKIKSLPLELDAETIQRCIELSNMPSVHSERKKGRWILKENIFKVAVAYCSACYEIDSHMPNFCPNCGADMREEEQK